MVVEQFAQCFTAVHMAEDKRVFEFGLDGNIAGRSHDFSLSRRRGHTNRWPSRGEQSIIIADVGSRSKGNGRSALRKQRSRARPFCVPRGTRRLHPGRSGCLMDAMCHKSGRRATEGHMGRRDFLGTGAATLIGPQCTLTRVTAAKPGPVLFSAGHN